MGIFTKKEKKEIEPQYYMSATNIPTYNYNVYHMSKKEKVLNFSIAFVVGALLGYLFYGGIGKDEFEQATTLTYVLNIVISTIVGVFAGVLFVPSRTEDIIIKKKAELNRQFRDMLDALTTSLNAGKNVNDSFFAVYEDMKIQYDEDSFILKELKVIISGINNNIPIEEVLRDFGKRSGNDDIKSFANVFAISYKKGGNIKEIIKNTHRILSDKMEIKEEIETLVASNDMEQKIMIIMPIGLVGVIKIMSPEFAKNFVSPAGIISTTIGVVVFVVAYFVGKSILKIKV